MDVGRNAMTRVAFRCLHLAPGLAALAVCSPAAAADERAQHGLLYALCWLALVLLSCQWLLRRRLSAEARVAELEAQLCLERMARARAEQALTDRHDVLRDAVRKQGSVRDAERARIARDIHDDLGQTMLALRIELSLLQVQTNGMHPAMHQKVASLLATLDQAIRSLRGVINGLRPLALDEGLRSAMERQLDEFSRITGVRHEFAVVGAAIDDAERSRTIDALLYRVLQEALSNVARHARASLVRVALGRDGERLVLRVEDDGVGMSTPPASHGCGLAGMRERACAEQGELSVASRAGAGTALALSVPLARQVVAG
jgi:signal transduction histidine kinase